METLLSHLRDSVLKSRWGYHDHGPNATEPAAFAALALHSYGEPELASIIAEWLIDLQSEDGSVGVTQSQATPAWPTSLASLVWLAEENSGADSRYAPALAKALAWILETKGKPLDRRRQIGHDTTIPGWSWAAATHSWLEPTCFCVLSLKCLGQEEHERTRQGIAMIVDRLHEMGGCNYGNTVVLGQATLPHVQPTGLAMLALHDENIDDPRIGRSLEYLEGALSERTATSSLCFALMGLTAHDRRPQNADELISACLQRLVDQQSLSCHKLALLALANRASLDWLPRLQVAFQTSLID